MATQTERDNQQVGVHTTSMRWRVCFLKAKDEIVSKLGDDSDKD